MASIVGPGLLPITIALITLVALIAFDTLAVIAALPQMTADLGDVDLLPWVVTAFLLTSAIATIVAGPVIDALGVRATFRATLVIFVGASALCAAAPSMLALVLARGLQGVGGGLLFAVAISAVALAYPEEVRTRAFAALSAVWGIMALGGPAIAALMVATVGWEGIFLVNVPIGIAAGALGWSRLPGRRAEASALRFSWLSLVLLAGFSAASMIGVSGVSWTAAAALVGAAGLAAAYWIHSGRTDTAILDRRYFAQMPLGAINVTFALAFGAALGIDAYLPLYVQGGLGHSAVVAAFSVAALSIGWSLASSVVTKMLDRWSAPDVALWGYGLLGPALLAALLVYDSSTPLEVVYPLAFVQGFGIGILSTSMLSLLQVEADPAEAGRASAAHQYVRGQILVYGVAISGAVVLLVVRQRLGDAEPVERLLAGDDVDVGQQAMDAISAGFRLAHLAAVGAIAVGAVMAVALRRNLAAAAPPSSPSPSPTDVASR